VFTAQASAAPPLRSRSSLIEMMILATFLAIVIAIYDHIPATGSAHVIIQVLGACRGVVGAFAGFVTLVGMLVFLFRHDYSSKKNRALWLTTFFFTASFGCSAYFFLV
jgi:hypothetical protein